MRNALGRESMSELEIVAHTRSLIEAMADPICDGGDHFEDPVVLDRQEIINYIATKRARYEEILVQAVGWKRGAYWRGFILGALLGAFITTIVMGLVFGRPS